MKNGKIKVSFTKDNADDVLLITIKESKFSWKTLLLGLLICIVSGLLGYIAAPWSINDESIYLDGRPCWFDEIRNTEPGNHTIEYVGNFHEYTYDNLITAIGDNPNISVKLDLSEMTGIDTMIEGKNWNPEFGDYKNINHVILPQKNKVIDTFAFYKCEEIKRIDINAKMIKPFAFAGCKLDTIVILSGVEYIHNFAFNPDFQKTKFIFQSETGWYYLIGDVGDTNIAEDNMKNKTGGTPISNMNNQRYSHSNYYYKK